MNDDTRPTPADEPTAQPTPAAPQAPQPATAHEARPAGPRDWAPPARTRKRLSLRDLAVAGVAAALLLVGGIGGFAIGHGTSGPGRPEMTSSDGRGGGDNDRGGSRGDDRFTIPEQGGRRGTAPEQGSRSGDSGR
ncbi:hypothetical protein V5P93_003100 [Actinokineospora auranticolor]|uniref:Uncharacterized protein n=1 Tax=Actinokineospora auranticolor TaxID=155976 RepID=A0A2S6H182_9PSEU|nr:hypothetical protein [Actinokineospora auranticolor]PPK71235.1 hypothetical protein CLV40_101424 [Actinokineospora auranticolor]